VEEEIRGVTGYSKFTWKMIFHVNLE